MKYIGTPSGEYSRWRSYFRKSMKKFGLFIFFISFAYSQQYPRWFLFQDQIKCKLKVVVAMKSPTFYKDSATAMAFRTGCDLLAKYTNVKISGGQAFWRTEVGVHSMGKSYSEDYDVALGDFYQSKLKVIDSFIDKQKTIVLSGDSSACVLDEQLQETISVQKIKQPIWVEELPNNNEDYFGVGTSEEYYYESSSWQRAEQNAVMALARSIQSKVISMQKSNAIESQDVFNEDLDVELQNVEIAARWRDVKKKVFYVLAKMKK